MRQIMQRGTACIAGVLLSACAHNSPYEPADPLEVINRPIFTFNQTADKYVLRPVTVGYVKVVPSPVRGSVSNFFDNLTYPTVIINDLLQAKFVQSGKDLTRLLLNSTFGLAGLFDPATMIGLKKNDEDLGQTLGRWGVGEGWYLMLPLLGPSTNRDLVGLVGDNWTGPLQYIDELDTTDRIVIYAAQSVDTRSHLLDLDSLLAQQLDPYLFVRTAYLQSRLNDIYDGQVPDDLLDLGLPE